MQKRAKKRVTRKAVRTAPKQKGPAAKGLNTAGQPRKRKAPNKLSANQSYALTNLLQAQLADVLEQGHTKEQWATQATNALGFKVVPSNLTTACKALGVNWPNGQKRKHVATSQPDLVAAIAALTAAVNALAAAYNR